MATLPRPPRDISPAQFFETWLPPQFEALVAAARAEHPGVTPPDLTAGATLEGEGGGAWTLAMRGGALTVTPGLPAAAEVTLRQSVTDWRALVQGEEGAPEVAPPGGNPLAMLASTNPALVQALRELRGTLRLEMPNYGVPGRTWAIVVTFNGATAPESTISVDAETALAIQRGTIQGPEAFFSGKIQLRGDTAFAMQVGMTLMAQMGR
jgi:putative sterol carrier protein